MGNWALLAELAKMSKVSDSTARRYANTFADYMHSKSFGRITKYQPESAAVLSRVSELYQEGRNTVEILDILPHEFPKLNGETPEEPEITWERPAILPDAGIMTEVKEALDAQSENIQRLAELQELRGRETEQLGAALSEKLQGFFDQLAALSKDINTHTSTQAIKNQELIRRLEEQGAELKQVLAAQAEKTQKLFDRLEQQDKEIAELKELAKAPPNPEKAQKEKAQKEQYLASIGKTAGEREKDLKPAGGQRTEIDNKTGAITTEGSRFKLEERILPSESRSSRESLPRESLPRESASRESLSRESLSRESVPPEGLSSALAGYTPRNDPAQAENQRLAQYLKDRKNPSEPKEPAPGWKFWANWKSKNNRRRK